MFEILATWLWAGPKFIQTGPGWPGPKIPTSLADLISKLFRAGPTRGKISSAGLFWSKNSSGSGRKFSKSFQTLALMPRWLLDRMFQNYSFLPTSWDFFLNIYPRLFFENIMGLGFFPWDGKFKKNHVCFDVRISGGGWEVLFGAGDSDEAFDAFGIFGKILFHRKSQSQLLWLGSPKTKFITRGPRKINPGVGIVFETNLTPRLQTKITSAAAGCGKFASTQIDP